MGYYGGIARHHQMIEEAYLQGKSVQEIALLIFYKPNADLRTSIRGYLRRKGLMPPSTIDPNKRPWKNKKGVQLKLPL
jgi:hypothetical protein